VDPDVAAHYELGLEESRLFVDGRPRLEYLRTLELLDRLLPPAPARLLDVGGGTGVYAVPLAERGYTVHVVDPVEAHVERARQHAQERGVTGVSASLGDARDLHAFGTGYDAMLLFGPLYHLVHADDRALALREAVRVTRPGGVVVAVGISRYASLIDGLRRRILDDPAFRSIVERDLRDGQHRNPDVRRQPEYFTTAYFHLPAELEREARDGGLCDVRLYAIEGPSWIVEDPDDIDNQLFAARAAESEPALMAASSHILVAGTTPTHTPDHPGATATVAENAVRPVSGARIGQARG
jgi:ubiquinone/menaquinone biosynthesis C-methylase UbiE